MDSEQDALSARLRAEDMRMAAPASLRARVRADIAAARRPGAAWFVPLAVAACVAAVVVAVVAVHDPVGAVIGDYKAVHVAVAEPRDLPPLFARELAFRPPVVDAAEAGCSLTGGRVARIGGQATAVLDYGCGGQAVSVYVNASAEGMAAPEAGVRGGYRVVSWRGRSLACRAVSRGADQAAMLRLAAYIQQRAMTV